MFPIEDGLKSCMPERKAIARIQARTADFIPGEFGLIHQKRDEVAPRALVGGERPGGTRSDDHDVPTGVGQLSQRDGRRNHGLHSNKNRQGHFHTTRASCMPHRSASWRISERVNAPCTETGPS